MPRVVAVTFRIQFKSSTVLWNYSVDSKGKVTFVKLGEVSVRQKEDHVLRSQLEMKVPEETKKHPTQRHALIVYRNLA